MKNSFFSHDRIDKWQSRIRTSKMKDFVYTWYHASTGNRGIRTIRMRSYETFISWLSKWNHAGFSYGWNYAPFDDQ